MQVIVACVQIMGSIIVCLSENDSSWGMSGTGCLRVAQPSATLTFDLQNATARRDGFLAANVSSTAPIFLM